MRPPWSVGSPPSSRVPSPPPPMFLIRLFSFVCVFFCTVPPVMAAPVHGETLCVISYDSGSTSRRLMRAVIPVSALHFRLLRPLLSSISTRML